MNYKEIIKQKVKEYLGLSDTLESYYGLNKQEVIMTAFADGAEAMREIANTWIPVEERLPDFGKTVLARDVGGYFLTALISVHGWINNERGEYFDIRRRVTHWKPITL